MAEIFEVVAQLSYDVENGGLKDALSLLNEQLEKIKSLVQSYADLNKAKSRMAGTDTEALEKVNKQLEKQKKALGDVTEAITKQVQGNEKLQAAITKQAGLVTDLAGKYNSLSRAKETAADPSKVNNLNGALGSLGNTMSNTFTKGSSKGGEFNSVVSEGIHLLGDLASGKDIGNGLANFLENAITTVGELATAGETAEGIFAALGEAMFGIPAIVAAITTAIGFFTDKLSKAKEAEKQAQEQHERFLGILNANHEEAARNTDEQITKLNVLRGVIESNSQSSQAAFNELKNQYPVLFKDINTLIDLQKHLHVFDEIKQEIVAKEKSIALTKDAIIFRQKEEEAIKNVKNAQQAVNIAQQQYNKVKNLPTSFSKTDNIIDPAANAKKQLDAAKDNLQQAEAQKTFFTVARQRTENGAKTTAIQAGDSLFADTSHTKTNNSSVKTDPYAAAIDNLEAKRAQDEASNEKLQSLREQENKLNKTYTDLYNSDATAGRVISQEERLEREENYRKLQERIHVEKELTLNELEQDKLKDELRLARIYKKTKEVARLKNELTNLDDEHSVLLLEKAKNREIIPQLDLDPNRFSASNIPGPKPVETPKFDIKTGTEASDIEKSLFGDTANITNRNERHRAELKKTLDAYKSLSHSAIESFNKINEAQQKALDQEISIRKQRVDIALKLAERGNTEALKQEQQRLDETIKKKEAYARRQQTLNAVLALSDAIVAVASAAAQTGPGAIAVVPAVIAAIIAGYAAVTSATESSTSQGFDKGGYTGDGNKHSPAGTVHKGEFVFTKEKTATYRQQFEAIHKGVDPAMIFNPKLVPVINHSNATTIQLNTLEKRLDRIADAVEGREVKVNQKLDAYGFSQSVETYKKWDRNRFK